MSSKRKSEPTKRAAAPKRNKKKTDDDFDSDFSDSNDGLPSSKDVEVLIPGSYSEEPASKLPEELLKTFDKEPGHLMVAGCVTWDLTGRRDTKGKVSKVRPNLYVFNRFMDEKYRAIISGPSSAHSILINMDRKAYSFGRNQFAQLGQPELRTYEKPTLVPEICNMNIIRAACGRSHTLFLTDTGTVYACGDNKSGQCGIGSSSIAMVTKPTRINYQGPPIIKVGCGADFSAILDIKGNLHTFGHPEYGQLGHNTDGKYFQTSTKISFHFEYSPKKVVLFVDKNKDGHVTMESVQIVDFTCGNNHTVAIDSQKRAYSWGFGGFGRLGHAEQKDEMVPRLIRLFSSQNRGVRSVFCGSTYSLAVNDVGVVMLFGQNKKTGEANMYPKPVHDLSGWNVTDIGTSNTSIVISADDSLIAWGASPTYGELGLGDLQKSSASPKEVTRMEGMKIPQVAMGYSHCMLLVNTDHALTKEKYDNMPKFEVDD